MFSKKVSKMNPSLTISISDKIIELKSMGEKIINLSIGEPDFKTPDNAKLGGIEGIVKDYTKYNNANGYLELRRAISNKLKKENKLDYSPDEIVVSSGAKHAITNTLIALLDQNDEVLVPKPYWVSYPETIKLLNGKPVFIETDRKNDFKLKVENIKKYVNKKTKAIIINNPSNPTGAVYSKEELVPIVNYCIENDIYIIADEIYERIIFDKPFYSIGQIEGAKDKTIIINGLSKSASMTGWRIGYTATNKKLAKAISSIQGHLVSHPSTISQRAGINALTKCENDIVRMVNIYKQRRNAAIKSLEEIDEISYIKPEGAFYLFMDFSSLKESINYKESFSLKVCEILLEEYKLALVPGIAFGEDDFIRLCYASDINSVKKGIDQIKKFVNEYKK